MALRDHFHPPLSDLRHWESFHARWATVIADTLETELLPPGYFAEVQVHVDSRVEVDIAAFEDDQSAPLGISGRGDVAEATATIPRQVWTPPAPAMVLPAVFPDRIEVLIFISEAGPTLVAAIELVSPRNKDRASSRQAFATKCANYLHHGVGLVIVDIVTNRRANLHNEMISLLGFADDFQFESDSIYAIAYRPIQRADGGEIDVWPYSLAVGESLPQMPLPLDKGQCLRLNLEHTYSQACQRMRLPTE
jgi:hypothetical protein